MLNKTEFYHDCHRKTAFFVEIDPSLKHMRQLLNYIAIV
jgi:hypothetical protein